GGTIEITTTVSPPLSKGGQVGSREDIYPASSQTDQAQSRKDVDSSMDGDPPPLPPLAKGGRIRVTIRDNGNGIADADRGRVFQPYFTTKDTGTGLGLFVCRRIMEQTIGGRIELVESSPAGTTFAVEVDCDPV